MIPNHITLQQLNEQSRQTLAEHLGNVFTGTGPDWIEAEMPVDHRTYQPYGILHGGAYVAPAETLGSVGSPLIVSDLGYLVAGVEINVDHIRRVTSRKVTGRANLLHPGKSSHSGGIRIIDTDTKLIGVSHLTVVILKTAVQ